MNTISRALVCGVLALSAALAVAAPDLATAQEQMKKRLPEIAQLKIQKIVGENNAGYLTLLKGTVEEAVRKLVDAENADRKTVYEAVAARTGTDADRVGRQRAREIADRAAAGIMLQREDGTWYQKQ